MLDGMLHGVPIIMGSHWMTIIYKRTKMNEQSGCIKLMHVHKTSCGWYIKKGGMIEEMLPYRSNLRILAWKDDKVSLQVSFLNLNIFKPPRNGLLRS